MDGSAANDPKQTLRHLVNLIEDSGYNHCKSMFQSDIFRAVRTEWIAVSSFPVLEARVHGRLKRVPVNDYLNAAWTETTVAS